MWLQFGSVSGTQRILLSSAFSWRMRNSATGLTSMKEPGNVGSETTTIAAGGAAGGGRRFAEEAVVGRVAERLEQQPVELDRAQLVVPLVLVRRALWDLDHDVERIRHRAGDYPPRSSRSPSSSSTVTPRRSAFSSLEPGDAPATR